MAECSVEKPAQVCIDRIIEICDKHIYDRIKLSEAQLENNMLRLEIKIKEAVSQGIQEALGSQNKVIKTAVEAGKIVIYVIVTIVGLRIFNS